MVANPGYLRFPHVVGEQLVFTAADEVWLAAASGGRAWRLTSDGVPVARPRLSPDGATVAWLSRRAGAPEVFCCPVQGGPVRQLTYFGSPSTTVQCFAPDGRLLVTSAAAQPFRSRTWAYAFSSDQLTAEAGGRPEVLPYGPVNGVALSAQSTVLGTGYHRDPAHWKRYRGGTAGRLWIAAHGEDGGPGEFAEFLPELVGPKTAPTWIGDRVAFLADFEGHGNVYSVAADGTGLRRHTDHSRFYARELTGDGTRLSYSCGGELWLLADLAADSEPMQLDIELTGQRRGAERVLLTAADYLGELSVDRTGRASAVEVAGNVVWLTHRDGPATTIAATAGVRHRLPVVLTSAPAHSAPQHPPGDGALPAEAGPVIAYVSDAEGEDAIEITSRDGTVRRFGAGGIGRVLELVASPDGSQLAIATHDGRLLVADTATGNLRELASSPHGEPSGLSFAPDSKWLAFSAAEESLLRSVRLVELATATMTSVTTERFTDTEPVFSLDGKYLVFLSARTFDPVYDAHVFDLSFPLATRPYLVTLAATEPSPFAAELAGRPSTAPEARPSSFASDPTAGQGGRHGLQTAAASVTVDLNTVSERVVAFPVAAGRLSGLLAVRGGITYLDAPVTGELGESALTDADTRPAVRFWDFATGKEQCLAEHADGAAAAGDGSVLVVRDGNRLRVVPATAPAAEDGSDTVEVDTERIRVEVQPRQQWQQMLRETARLMRQHYWVPDLADVDWDAVLAKYLPLVDRLGSRDDLSDLIWELNGETGASHAYETPPRREPDARLRPAFLGADIARGQDGDWTLSRVLAGDNSVRGGRSPLRAPGVQLAPGDVLVSINGLPVGAAGPAQLLLGTADKPVQLRVRRPTGPAPVEWSVVVTPLADEGVLRYLDWVTGRRAAVQAATGGQVGYLHVPDMVAGGWAAFHRDLRVEIAKPALIVDTRDNAGGHTSQLIIEKLARRVIGWTTVRHYPSSSYPEDAPRGPLVSIANEWAGSDGDIVNAAFKILRLGTIVGTRTWGGVIGIDGRYHLVDGTGVTQPRYAFWFTELGWTVENHGVDPDLVVECPPHAWAAGGDPQLQAAIFEISRLLAEAGAAARPDPATRPSRRAPQLQPRPVE